MRKKSLLKRILLGALILLCTVVAGLHILVAFLYRQGLRTLPADYSYIDALPAYERFNTSLWISEAGNIPIRMQRISHYSYLGSMLFSPKEPDKEREKERRKGWYIASLAARILITDTIKNSIAFSLDWHLAQYSATVWVSRHIPAEECLKLIADKSYFGHGYYGVANAAKGYFGKDPNDLSVDEASYLLVMMRNPSYDDSPSGKIRLEKRMNEIKRNIENWN